MRVVLSDVPFSMDPRAARLIERHPRDDPGSETEPKYRLLGLDTNAMRIGRSSWPEAKRFFHALREERQQITAEFRALQLGKAPPWLLLVERMADLLGITAELARGETPYPALLSLHVVARTRALMPGEIDGDGWEPSLLLAQRNATCAFHPGATSASFEEQFTEVDLPVDGYVTTWVANCARRGSIEEFGLDESPEVDEWSARLEQGTTIRSLVLETDPLNLALIATLELPWTRAEFEELQMQRQLGDAPGSLELTGFAFCRLTATDIENQLRRIREDQAGWHPTAALRLQLARRTWLAS